MGLLSAQEHERIEARIGDVEQRTAAEIIVVTSRSSDRYLDVKLAAASMSALVAASIAHFVWPNLTVDEVLSLELLLGGLGFLLASQPWLLRRLVPRERSRIAVERACELSFLEHAAFETRDRTGVVIYLSELEHQVAILGDKGIHARVETKGWSELVAHIVRSIHAGKACDGVCEVVDKLGATLSEGAPIREGDTNELSNHVRQRG